LPPAWFAKDLHGGRTQLLNINQIWRINHHPVKCYEDSSPDSISDTEDWLNWNGTVDIPHDTGDDCVADHESHIEQGNGIEDPEWPLPRDVSGEPTVTGLIRPTRKSKRQAGKVLVMVNAIETRRNQGVNNK
jgi:hypothetical protein